MSEDFELIKKKEADLCPLCASMEILRLQFINDTAKFAAKWYESTAKQYVTKNSEVTLNLSRENLATMKSRVKELVKNASQIVKISLSEPNVWWHQVPDKNAALTQYEQLGNEQVGNRFPESIDNPVRRALGELGTVLEQFGYDVTTSATLKGAYPEFWFERKTGTALARPYFPHLLEWSGDMQATLEKYDLL